MNEVRFDTRRLIFKCSTTFRRTLLQEAGTIEIEMTGFKAGWGKLAPHARSSHASYTVTDRGTHREIVYRQDVETDKPVAGYSLRVLRKSMGEFARDLDQYLQRPDLARVTGDAAGAYVKAWRTSDDRLYPAATALLRALRLEVRRPSPIRTASSTASPSPTAAACPATAAGCRTPGGPT